LTVKFFNQPYLVWLDDTYNYQDHCNIHLIGQVFVKVHSCYYPVVFLNNTEVHIYNDS
jgi:hypothetical protein